MKVLIKMYKKITNRPMTKRGLFIIALIIQIMVIPFCNTTIFTDGINPLALGFIARGENWSQYLIADGYYYKYGQLLVYFPFIYLIGNNVILYKILLVINAVIVSLIPVCAFEILMKHLKCTSLKKGYFVALLVGIIPSITLNSKYTWAEPILMCIPWIIMLLLLKCMENVNDKMCSIYSILIAALQVYAYMVHTRGIVILIATLICVFAIRVVLKCDKIRLVPYVVVTVGMLVLDRKISGIIKNILYQGSEDLVGASASFVNGEFLKTLFSVDGLKVWFGEMLGWIYAEVISTFGLVSLGIIVSIVILLNIKNRANMSKVELIIVFFSMLYFIGSLSLGTIFFFNDIYSLESIEMAKRGDKLVYARYIDGAGACISFIGLYYFILKGKIWTKTRIFSSVAFFIVLHGFFVSTVIQRINSTISWLHISMTFNYFCNLKQCIRGGMYSTIYFFGGGIAIFGFVSLCIYMISIIWRKKEKLIFGIYFICFLAGYLWSSYNAIYRMDSYSMGVIEDYDELVKSIDGVKDLKNIYLDDEILRCSFQYIFSDYYIVTKRDDNRYNIQNMFILSSKDAYNKELFEDDYYEILGLEENNSDYHMYIKGDELKEILLEKGYICKKVDVTESN